MCGRYTLATPAGELVEAFDVPDLTFDHTPRYNIAPGQEAPIVARDRRGRRMGLMGWGIVPDWKDTPSRPLINARAESVARRPSFADAFNRHRCLVPADGFYEWKRVPDGSKTPHWIHPIDGRPFAFAGIWETWTRLGVTSHGFAIITTEASADVREVHDRMPAVVGAAEFARWLDPSTRADVLAGIMEPAPQGTFACRRVSRRVNQTREDDPLLIEAEPA